jgi:hypothetical protein
MLAMKTLRNNLLLNAIGGPLMLLYNALNWTSPTVLQLNWSKVLRKVLRWKPARLRNELDTIHCCDFLRPNNRRHEYALRRNPLNKTIPRHWRTKELWLSR